MGAGIFNGDVGRIQTIDPASETLTVLFDDRLAEYDFTQLGELEPAYAMTVHKSQGSEYDCVVLPLYDVPTKLRYRNLLYTAVTRAKKLLVVVGDESVWLEMAANDKKTLRYTFLKQFLKEADIYETGNIGS